MKAKFSTGNGALRAFRRRIPFALVCLCLFAPARAAEAPEWQKACETLPDTNCVVWIQFDPNGGVVDFFRPFAGVTIVEATRDSPQKVLRILVHLAAEPATPNGAVQVAVDSRPFAAMSFTHCAGLDCIGETQISSGDVATLERAQSLEIQAPNFKAISPIRNFAAARAGKGRTIAEVNAEMAAAQQRIREEMQKSIDKLNKQRADEEAKRAKEILDEAPAARKPGGFCAALKRVMADVPDQFKSIKDKKDNRGWSSRVNLPGSGTCRLDINSIYSNYSCTTSFRSREVADKQMASLAQMVGKCLSDRKARPTEGAIDQLPMISFDKKGSKVDVWVTLQRQKSGNVSLYDVDVSVSD